MAAALTEDDTPELHAADTVAAGAGLVDPAMARLLAEEGPAAVRALAALGAPFDRTADGGFAQSLEAAHSPRPRRPREGRPGRPARSWRRSPSPSLAAPHIEVRDRRDAARPAAGRRRPRPRRRWPSTTASSSRSPPAAVILATGGIGGLYAVTTTPAELQRRGPGAGRAGRRARSPTPSSCSSTPPPSTSAAIPRRWPPRRCAARAPAGRRRRRARSWPATIRDAELAPRDVVARAIHAERRAGRGAFLDARAAVGAHFPDEFPAVFAACMGGRRSTRASQPIPVAPACHYHMGGIATDARRPHLAWPACSPPASAPRPASTAPTAWPPTPCWRPPSSAPAPARAAADETDPATAPLLAPPRRDLPADALAQLRLAMSRDAGVVRDRAGLTPPARRDRRAGSRARPRRAAGRRPPGRRAARWPATESRGGHYRADARTAPQPAAPHLRHSADLRRPRRCRFAAE